MAFTIYSKLSTDSNLELRKLSLLIELRLNALAHLTHASDSILIVDISQECGIHYLLKIEYRLKT